MQFTTTVIALTTALLPSVLALPAQSTSFKLPTCGAEQCLPASLGGKYGSCALSDLDCLCALPQAALTAWAAAVQPCIDGSEGKAACTPGAIFQYKGLVQSVCNLPQYDAKVINWAPTPIASAPVVPVVADVPVIPVAADNPAIPVAAAE